MTTLTALLVRVLLVRVLQLFCFSLRSFGAEVDLPSWVDSLVRWQMVVFGAREGTIEFGPKCWLSRHWRRERSSVPNGSSCGMQVFGRAIYLLFF